MTWCSFVFLCSAYQVGHFSWLQSLNLVYFFYRRGAFCQRHAFCQTHLVRNISPYMQDKEEQTLKNNSLRRLKALTLLQQVEKVSGTREMHQLTDLCHFWILSLWMCPSSLQALLCDCLDKTQSRAAFGGKFLEGLRNYKPGERSRTAIQEIYSTSKSLLKYREHLLLLSSLYFSQAVNKRQQVE